MKFQVSQKQIATKFDELIECTCGADGFQRKSDRGETYFARSTPDGSQTLSLLCSRWGYGYQLYITTGVRISKAVELVWDCFPHLGKKRLLSLLMQFSRFATAEEIMLGHDPGIIHRGVSLSVFDEISFDRSMIFLEMVLKTRIVPFLDEFSSCCQIDRASNELMLDDFQSPHSEISGVALAKCCGKHDWREVASRRLAAMRQVSCSCPIDQAVHDLNMFVEFLSAKE
ncbi:MAG: hypothetical protein U0929_03590 [Planctomycetaceae bacterium]